MRLFMESSARKREPTLSIQVILVTGGKRSYLRKFYARQGGFPCSAIVTNDGHNYFKAHGLIRLLHTFGEAGCFSIEIEMHTAKSFAVPLLADADTFSAVV